jgi:hypothetical protein
VVGNLLTTLDFLGGKARWSISTLILAQFVVALWSINKSTGELREISETRSLSTDIVVVIAFISTVILIYPVQLIPSRQKCPMKITLVQFLCEKRNKPS